jgi:hypothetical protein
MMWSYSKPICGRRQLCAASQYGALEYTDWIRVPDSRTILLEYEFLNGALTHGEFYIQSGGDVDGEPEELGLFGGANECKQKLVGNQKGRVVHRFYPEEKLFRVVFSGCGVVTGASFEFRYREEVR